MNRDDIEYIFQYLEKNSTDKFEELYSSFDFFTKNLITVKEEIAENLKQKISQGEYSDIATQSEVLQKIDGCVKDLSLICAKYNPDDFNSSQTMDNLPKEKLNYKDYCVDKEEQHNLNEDFTNKRPFAFLFLSENQVKVSTWKDLYILVCEILLKKNEQKFISLKDILKGKREYISYNPSVLRTPYKLSNGMYIETNQSAKHLMQNLKFIINAYGYSVNELKIYLTADYTNLHKKDDILNG